MTEGEQAALKALVLRGPNSDEGISRDTIADLCDLAEDRFGIRCAETSLGRPLKRLGLTLQKARPVHPKTALPVQERFTTGA